MVIKKSVQNQISKSQNSTNVNRLIKWIPKLYRMSNIMINHKHQNPYNKDLYPTKS